MELPTKPQRRQQQRYPVEWPGTLSCLFPSHEENVAVRISEISITGARIELEKLRIGPYHIVVASDSSEFTLHVSMLGIEMSTRVRIVWYSMNDEEKGFTVGVLFPELPPPDWTMIEQVLKERK